MPKQKHEYTVVPHEMMDDYTLYTDALQPKLLVCDRLTYSPFDHDMMNVDVHDPIITIVDTCCLWEE